MPAGTRPQVAQRGGQAPGRGVANLDQFAPAAVELAADPKSHAQAVELYNGTTADLMEPYIEALHKLTEMQLSRFENASDESGAAYRGSRNVILTIIGAAVIFGVFLAIMLARSIVRPLGIAVSGAIREISGSIRDFPTERADGGSVDDAPEDELSRRRSKRAIS